jgi:tetratricopeptide (TPR) repeat protein
MANRNQVRSPNKAPSRKKVVWFKAIAVFLPFILLILVEVALRLFHYGHDLSLFIEYPEDKTFLVLNPNAAKRYFNDPALAPTGNRELFKKEKDKNTCRIFVLGESTTIGYPYFHNGSFHRWLQYRLMHTYPDRHFEIINLSVTAVNSYMVLGFAKELVDYEPDAVLIYCGQNEYYGALGVGSTNRISGNSHIIQLMLSLRQLRVTQLITSLYGKVTGAFKSASGYSAETLMQRMVADQQIAYGSKLYHRGIEQFRSNMDQTLQLFSAHHIPVFISNLVSNEKGLKPFISMETDSTRFPAFKKEYELGVKAFKRNEWQAADSLFKKADLVYNGHALCNYFLGQVSDRLGDYATAEARFAKALDLDVLRFRAPSALNTVIAQLCSKYPVAHLVDTRAAFVSHAAHHIIGSDLILEHVHPNLTGYALMSDVFYEALKKEHIFSVDIPKEMSLPQLVEGMPITSIDSLTGLYKIAKLKRSWPFDAAGLQDSLPVESTEQKLAYDLAFEHIRWRDAMNDLYRYYVGTNQLIKAKKVMEGMILEYPMEASLYEITANICGKLKDLENAGLYFRKAFALSPSPELSKKIFVIYLDLDEPADAIPYLDYAINNLSDKRLVAVKKYSEEIEQLERAFAKDSAVYILNEIADRYFRMGNKLGVTKYLGKVLSADPQNKDALLMLARVNQDEPDSNLKR